MQSRHQRPMSPRPPYRTHGRGPDAILPGRGESQALVPWAARDILDDRFSTGDGGEKQRSRGLRGRPTRRHGDARGEERLA
jgi:hypothetical protein